MPVKVYYPGKRSSNSHNKVKSDHQTPSSTTSEINGHLDEVVVTLIKHAIDTRNIPILAHLARQHGIPSDQRQDAWPLLIDSHPYSQQQAWLKDCPPGLTPDQIPIKRIRGEIGRYRRRHPRNNQFAWSRYECRQQDVDDNDDAYSASSSSSSSHTPSSPALSSTSSMNSTTATTTTATNGLSTNSNAYKPLPEPLADEAYKIIEDSVVKFLIAHGGHVPYESGLVHIALDLSEWISPLNSNILEVEFSYIYDKLMRIILYSPEKTPDSSPIADRISLFLSALKLQVSDLATFFNDEGVISYSGDDEWLLWWIKWYGARSWKSTDRARSWDLLVGYRDGGPSAATAQNLLNQASQQQENPLLLSHVFNEGMDPFWNPKDENFSPPPPFEQHIFLCVAVLQAFKDQLEELEQSEIREFLGYPPKIDNMNSLIVEAGYLWRQWQAGEEQDGDFGAA